MRALITGAISFFLTSALPCGRPGDHPAPEVTVNLDDRPQDRWLPAFAQFREQVMKTFNTFSKDASTKELLQIVEGIMGVDHGERAWFPEEQYLELEGMAKAAGLKTSELFALNMYYDLTAAASSNTRMCTSIVAENTAGEMSHGRNLDYDLQFVDVMKDIAATVSWMKGGKLLFKSVSFIGTVGFNSAFRPGAFTLSQDERDQGQLVGNLLEVFVRHRVATFSFIREIAQNAKTFDEALNMLQTVKLDAPSYFILGGPQSGQGAVVTRWQSHVADVWHVDAAHGLWYLLETNYDHWKAPDKGDNRRAVGHRFMDAHGQEGFTNQTMLDALSVDVFNKTAGERGILNRGTVYTAVLSTMQVVVRGKLCQEEIVV